MKAYVITTAVIFALLTVAHLARIVAEGLHLATDPFFGLITLASAGMCIWAWRVIRSSTRP